MSPAGLVQAATAAAVEFGGSSASAAAVSGLLVLSLGRPAHRGNQIQITRDSQGAAQVSLYGVQADGAAFALAVADACEHTPGAVRAAIRRLLRFR